MSLARRALLITSVTVAALAGAPAAHAQVAGCDLIASPSGSDAATGTLDVPIQSAAKLVASLAPGQTGCFRSGTYGWNGDLLIRAQDVTLTSYPGEHATLTGRIIFMPTADGAVIEDVTLDGRNSQNKLSPLIHADLVALRDNEITNHHTAICVHLDGYPGYGPPQGVVIEGNRIHDCGRLPATNFDHGIYIAEATDTVIRNNWIYSNADRGIQLYPDADGTQVTGNVIDSNGQGVLFSGTGGDTSDNNLVANNVISNSKIRSNVESYWDGGSSGTGNVARDNCIFGGARDDGDGGIGDQVGFSAEDNLIAQPDFVDRAAGNFELSEGSPCAAILAGAPVPAGAGADADRSESDDPPRASVTLSVSDRNVRTGEQLEVSGEIRGAELDGEGRSAVIKVLRGGDWTRFATARLNSRGRFEARARVRASGRSRLRLRAEIRDVGSSRLVPVRVRASLSP